MTYFTESTKSGFKMLLFLFLFTFKAAKPSQRQSKTHFSSKVFQSLLQCHKSSQRLVLVGSYFVIEIDRNVAVDVKKVCCDGCC